MTTINIERRTSLRGQQLRERVNQAFQSLLSRPVLRPHARNVQRQWVDGNNMTFSVPGLIENGRITVQDGSPSVVRATATLRGAAAGMRGTVTRMVEEEMTRYLPAPGAGPERETTADRSEVQPGESPSADRQERERRRVDMDTLGAVFGQIGLGLSNAFGQEAVDVAQQEAQAHGKDQGTQYGIQQGDGFTMGAGKQVGPGAPLPGSGPAGTPETRQEGEGPTRQTDTPGTGMPTWGWVLIGGAGLTGLGLVAWLLLRKKGDDDIERNARRKRESRAYTKMKRIGKKTRKRAYGPKGLKREVISMRDAGYSISEIASALGINRNMVKTWIRQHEAA